MDIGKLPYQNLVANILIDDVFWFVRFDQTKTALFLNFSLPTYLNFDLSFSSPPPTEVLTKLPLISINLLIFLPAKLI